MSIGNVNMTCSGVVLPYHTLHNTPHSPLLPTTTPHTANHTPHTNNGKPLSSRNIPLNPSPSNLRPHTLHIRPRTSDPGRPREAKRSHREGPGAGGRDPKPSGPKVTSVFCLIIAAVSVFFCCCHGFCLLLSLVFLEAISVFHLLV